MENQQWDLLWQKIGKLRQLVYSCRTRQVSQKVILDFCSETIRHYFRNVRASLMAFGVDTTSLDDNMQTLINLTAKKTTTSAYKSAIKDILAIKPAMQMRIEMNTGEHTAYKTTTPIINDYESKIISTLQRISPVAALSYQQSMFDIIDTKRMSFKGTAAELRETVRGVLDQLAPDNAVATSPGFKLEPQTDKPTMKQKTKFILKSRGMPSGAMDTSTDSVALIEELTGKLARSTYNRGSITAHTSGELAELKQLKMYVDTILCELLEIHKS